MKPSAFTKSISHCSFLSLLDAPSASILVLMFQVVFRMSDTHAGFGRCDGILSVRPEALHFEFQSKVAGILRSAVKSLVVPITDIVSVDYRSGFFSNRVVIRFKSLQSTQDFPKSDGNEVTLEIRRRDRAEAKSLVSEVKLLLLNTSLDDLLGSANQSTG